MNETYKVRMLGGTLVVTLPQKIVRALSLKAGDDVKITIVNTGRRHAIAIEPTKETKGKR